MRLAGLCKGSTADSDSVCEGSNPSPAAKGKQSIRQDGLFFFHLTRNSNPHIISIASRSAKGAEGSNPSPAAKKAVIPFGVAAFLHGEDSNGSSVRKRAGGTFSPRPGLRRSGGRILLPLPSRRKLHIACDDFFALRKKVLSRSFRCSSFQKQNRANATGLVDNLGLSLHQVLLLFRAGRILLLPASRIICLSFSALA